MIGNRQPRRHTAVWINADKRAQEGSDFDLDRLVALSPPCHAQTDAPYVHGRLVITPFGEGRHHRGLCTAYRCWTTVARREFSK